MELNDGAVAEYERRHRPIWKEMEEVLLGHGVHTYSIYVDPKSTDLFGYVEVENEEMVGRRSRPPRCAAGGGNHMRDVMATNGDDSPVSRDLREVFHIERADPAP